VDPTPVATPGKYFPNACSTASSYKYIKQVGYNQGQLVKSTFRGKHGVVID
jgi:hypothetical protein